MAAVIIQSNHKSISNAPTSKSTPILPVETQTSILDKINTTIATSPNDVDLSVDTDQPNQIDEIDDSNQIVTDDDVLALDKFINADDCGRRLVRRPKIINGSNALHGQYPWMISLMLNNRHHCGGSLINENWILTAAHCVYHVDQTRFQVKLGGHFRNKESEPTSITINEVIAIPHPGFNFAHFNDDLALIRLSKRVSYTRYIQPICLPSARVPRTQPPKATVIGWGKLRQGGFSADTLQEVEIPIVDNDKCVSWYREMGKILSIKHTQICAGLEQGGKDACQGDSGSPMMITDRSKRSTVIGVVSAGIGCALPKLPGLYTRVSSYLDWIKNIMDKYDRLAFEAEQAAQTAPTIANEEIQTEVSSVITTVPDVDDNDQNGDNQSSDNHESAEESSETDLPPSTSTFPTTTMLNSTTINNLVSSSASSATNKTSTTTIASDSINYDEDGDEDSNDILHFDFEHEKLWHLMANRVK
ncbi:serine protease-like protein 10 [Sarcoptes scabiei]|uniref:Serine protease-like protein 10 n=1 Tax=Sarcoptes scabiei TaxID=52283 RepID=A0A132AL14_SARSC|nr:serine protease-like protein 10 [Sarcoptes scabiei]